MIIEFLIVFGISIVVLCLLNIITDYLFDKLSNTDLAYALSLAFVFSLWYIVMKYID